MKNLTLFIALSTLALIIQIYTMEEGRSSGIKFTDLCIKRSYQFHRSFSESEQLKRYRTHLQQSAINQQPHWLAASFQCTKPNWLTAFFKCYRCKKKSTRNLTDSPPKLTGTNQ